MLFSPAVFLLHLVELLWYKVKQCSKPQYPSVRQRWLLSPICGKELLAFILKTEGGWEKNEPYALCVMFQWDGPDLQLCPAHNKPTEILLFWLSSILRWWFHSNLHHLLKGIQNSHELHQAKEAVHTEFLWTKSGISHISSRNMFCAIISELLAGRCIFFRSPISEPVTHIENSVRTTGNLKTHLITTCLSDLPVNSLHFIVHNKVKVLSALSGSHQKAVLYRWNLSHVTLFVIQQKC